MGIRHRIEDQIKSWPVYRQVTGTDRLGRGEAAKSRASGRLAPRTQTADAVVRSVCPYCPVGCGQNVYAGAYIRAGQVLSVLGVAGAVLGRAGGGRGRAISALSGASLLAASAATRWGIFHAGLASAADPKYTVVPQRERREARQRERAGAPGQGQSGTHGQERAGPRGQATA